MTLLRTALSNGRIARVLVAWAAASLGSWAFAIVLSLYAYREGGAGAVALALTVRMLPSALAAPYAAMLADRHARRTVLVVGSALCAASLVGIAAAAAADAPFAVVLVLAVAFTSVRTAYRPAQAALLTELARTPAELGAGNVCVSTIESVGFLLGALLAGALAGLVGLDLAFLACAVPFALAVPVLVALPAGRRVAPPEEGAPGGFHELLEGLRTVLAHRDIRLFVGVFTADAFVQGAVDVTPIGFLDAGWISYDKDLGPALRSDPSLSVTYYGFDTRQKPFDDARVRKAFAQAVDWRRLATLDELGSSVAATSLVPAGIPGRPDGDFLPPYDPGAARALLAEAGYATGAALGPISFIASGGGYDGALIAMLEQNLGVTIDYATMDFGTYQDRLSSDPPDLWSLSWVADYPGSNDFLGVLLGTGSTSNEGGWSNPDFDAAIADAGAAGNPEDATAAYARALEIVRDQAPAVPVSYGTSYTLVRDGLLGATQNGLGILRLAGLAWAR